MKCGVNMRQGDVPSPAPTSTTVAWDQVTGDRLEALLHGLFEAMGATDLVWRAGSDTGVTAADGGRDLEATFAIPTPDGSIDRSLWWIEAKGRAATMPRDVVVGAVNELLAHSEVDVFVFCTNSRYSNPTRDWVSKWQAKNPRPKIRLWDRDDLSRLVREYPMVAARALPEALADADRLNLLLERFNGLGETPILADLEYFWNKSPVVSLMPEVIGLVAMFAYAEDEEGLVLRPWASLLPTGPSDSAAVIHYALVRLPMMLVRELARPVGGDRLMRTSAYLILASMHDVPPELLWQILYEPHKLSIGYDEIDDKENFSKVFRESITIPTWGRILSELADVCADDCVRVSRDPDAFGAPMLGRRYWRRFGVGESPEGWNLVMERDEEECAVGLPLNSEHRCPLVADVELTEVRVKEAREIVVFRRNNPDGQYRRIRQDHPDPLLPPAAVEQVLSQIGLSADTDEGGAPTRAGD